MAVLKIYNDIVDDQEKLVLQEAGTDSTTFSDIRDFISNLSPDDPDIDIRLHCDGGDCVEGWSIYDALRQTDKKISATVEGKCSSIATIILLTAPLERRYAYRNASICIHNPALAGYEVRSERLTSEELEQQADKMRNLASQLRVETGKLLDLYVSRTGSDRKLLSELMDKDIYIDMQTAMALGFIGSILPEMNDSKKQFKFKNNKEMTKGKIECDANAVQRVCSLFGVEKIEDINDIKIIDQYITSSSGDGFTVEREDGDPQVGDIAYPDGDYVMDDGSHVIVQDGVITDITRVDDSEPSGPGDEGGDLTPDQQQAVIDNLQAQIDDFKKQIASKDDEISALKGNQTTDEQREILTLIAKAGGKKWLDKITSMKSTFTTKNRTFVAHKTPGQGDGKETKTQRMIREAKEANAKKRNRKME
ncbi:ATP-dependent Clp protease proteolytic subunit [uncultured Prevotella sp.]|uniref:ATP-dependent Clp protease proteolytic subunit n=1 Tax=uncultured Prevotella sp. TaxID=159272 RepID=UPI002598BA3E|nr:ATP-dependent Clp protease proteolytic subunit [uncultured Prevotella sp.]